MTKQFRNVGVLHPGRSAFDLSYEKKLSCDMGQLIPIMCDEVVPGDIITLGNQSITYMQPLASPVLHEINQYCHYFFVPYRLLWEDWEDFITGGEDGQDASVMPTWIPASAGITAVGSLWDYLGFPTSTDPQGAYPIDMPRRAYNMIYNTYYRQQETIPEVALTNDLVLIRAWEKDYFTASLENQQRGIAPALPVSGSALWDIADFVTGAPAGGSPWVNTGAADTLLYHENAQGATNMHDFLESNTLTTATFDVADLRLAFQIQKWMERNNRAGSRYVEFLLSHFGTTIPDSRLQNPEYIGGTKAPIITNPVIQTSETNTTPQGYLTGTGGNVNVGYVGKYRVQEFGLIMGIMSIMPRTSYQQGIDRQWLRYDRYDFYFPEFANLSEQAIIRAEIYANNVSADNNTVFGYIGQYDEMRTKRSMICGQFRTTFDYWHISRQFGAAPALNQAFIECVPRKDIFAVPAEPGFLIQFGNLIKAIRPMPFMSNPGLIDHN